LDGKKGPEALAEYINVDLEIRSRVNLQPLVDALSQQRFSLYVGRDRRRTGASVASLPLASAAERQYRWPA